MLLTGLLLSGLPENHIFARVAGKHQYTVDQIWHRPFDPTVNAWNPNEFDSMTALENKLMEGKGSKNQMQMILWANAFWFFFWVLPKSEWKQSYCWDSALLVRAEDRHLPNAECHCHDEKPDVSYNASLPKKKKCDLRDPMWSAYHFSYEMSKWINFLFTNEEN